MTWRTEPSRTALSVLGEISSPPPLGGTGTGMACADLERRPRSALRAVNPLVRKGVLTFTGRLGIRRIMFAVDDIEDVFGRLHAHGAELIGEAEQYEDSYRLCYVRGPEGIMAALAEQLS